MVKYIASNIHIAKQGFLSQEDYDLCSRSFNLNSEGYARIGSVKVHRLIMERILKSKIEPNKVVDHINRNRLDNRRENLRLCNISENAKNVGKQKGTSKFKGVSWKSSRNKWYSQIKLNGKVKYLGLFDSELDAATAYNNAARLYHGNFAALNNI